jgi:DNA topoisomerase-6 subunit A
MKKMSEKNDVSKKLEGLGVDVLNLIQSAQNPFIKIPVRSLSNVNYDQDSGLLQLGNAMSKRVFFNVAHARKFMQTLVVASFCKSLVEEDVHASLRESYYSLKHTIGDSKENTFEEQAESDPIFVDLEVALDVLRENLHVNADRKGAAVGPISILDKGDTIDWSKLGSGGWSIPSNVENIQFKDIGADFVLMVEKNAIFERLNEDKLWKKLNCIIISSQGQASRGIRRLINRFNTQHKLPVYCFCDADAYGFYIYSVIKAGSMELAHVSNRLATPKAKFIGLTLSDVKKYDLGKATIKAKDVDLKRTQELLGYTWFQNKEWQKELKLMLDLKIKAELEALASKNLKFVSDTYLPEKIENRDFLP